MNEKKSTASRKAAASPAGAGKMRMIISYVPGEETRVAVVEESDRSGGRRDNTPQWRLEEYHAERAGHISRVGNIYSGVVSNVEQSIQAAFVDFGFEQHGFLHVTDLHPQYFPGEDDDTTESVGKKTPRRERPPIQRCLRRGDVITVQVLKDGVGTKGPTLTSYLSIPGRFLVMMPQMDRVGVSRKVEDEDQRREMRAILDQLDLPEGFGFILRTAGMERTKTELKRDLAYLQRLWKDMEARRITVGKGKPTLLYSESDLLVRALRDLLGPEIDEVVIDHEAALKRAGAFLKIVAPRSKTRLMQHTGRFPLFHAFGIEPQIGSIHAREVPLPSGGRLVIDETEALVAIDVNSGKMRDASDSETNAYRTNLEAVDEICRQLKLRDLGGIIINDLIDMRHASNRKEIEQRMKDRLKRDRARTTTLQISQFGILEMTRQRMRGSQETQNFADCPICRGRGLVQRPDSVSGDALRELSLLLAYDNITKVELVVAPRVASEFLSSRRRELGRIERLSGKHVDVRVSETVPVDRVTYYAYDAAGADVDIEKLPRPKPPKDLKPWDQGGDWAAEADAPTPEPEPDATIEESTPHPIEIDEPFIDDDSNEGSSQRARSAGQASDRDQLSNDEGGGRRRRRRRRRGRGGRGNGGGDEFQASQDAPQTNHAPQVRPDRQHEPNDDGSGNAEESGPEGGTDGSSDGQQPTGASFQGDQAGVDGEQGGRRRRRRRRRGRGGRGGDGPGAEQGSAASPDAGATAETPDNASSEQPVLDDLAPRGDSWDLEPNLIQPLPSADRARRNDRDQPAPSDRPRPEKPRPIGGDADASGQDAEADAGEESLPNRTQDRSGDGEGEGQPGEGGRRRRRRRRGRGGGGGGTNQDAGQQGGSGGGQRSDQRRGNPPPRSGNAPRNSDSGGSMRETKPSSDRSASGPSNGNQSGPAAGPRFLYSSRRKLAPGEIPTQRRE